MANINPFGDFGGSLGFGGASDFGGGLKSIGGAVADLYSAEGKRAEAKNYDLAAGLADKNVQYTTLSTAIKNMQAERQIYQTIGEQTAGVAAAGFTAGGSAGDLLRSSVSQGSLTHAVISQQGLIQEESYKEQAESYRNMADAANKAAEGLDIGTGLKAVSAIASFIGL
jgi:hypothetical protein